MTRECPTHGVYDDRDWPDGEHRCPDCPCRRCQLKNKLHADTDSCVFAALRDVSRLLRDAVHELTAIRRGRP